MALAVPGISEVERVESGSHGSSSIKQKRRPTFYWDYLRICLWALSVTVLLFLTHPKLLNLLFYVFGPANEIPEMKYVSNFYLWTRYNPRQPETVVVGLTDSLLQSHFRSYRKTYVLIHGFMGTGLDQWLLRLKDALLWREDCNVFSVDWLAGHLTAGYYVIRDRVRDVGSDVSLLVEFLMKTADVHPGRVHFIGHSLGAHVAGFAGKYLNGHIGRITGLDPAGLGYNGAAQDSKLNSGDAVFVDIIHTHGCYTLVNQWTDCYGTFENMGDADFWPNGGEYQPACDEGGDGAERVREGSNCHHGLAYAYYTDSIYSYPTTTVYLARPCSSSSQYNEGLCPCGDMPQYMGHNANPLVKGVFYLNTSNTAPYGLRDHGCSPATYSVLKLSAMLFFTTLFVVVAFLGLVTSTSCVLQDIIKENIKSVFDHSFNFGSVPFHLKDREC